MKDGKSNSLSHVEAVEILAAAVDAVETEKIGLSQCAGRILAQEIRAVEDVPSFDRSPLDGYAFRAEDVKEASADNPVTLKVLEEIAAGDVAHFEITEGTASRIMTGAPIPEGADAVTMYEVTEFTDKEVKIFRPAKPGENIVRTGEDVKKGTLLAKAGMKIDAGLAGTIAFQNIEFPTVYRKLKVGVISTGSELQNVGTALAPGKIYDSNSHTFVAACLSKGFEAINYGIVKDTAEEISDKLENALTECDAVILTGGASVGDFDVTPEAMENCGAKILFRGVKLKPGMACAFAIKDGKLICGLSGNPASALTTFYVVALPALRKMAGETDCIPKEFTVSLADDFNKKSKGLRVLRGKLDLSTGEPALVIPSGQGNVVISSAIGADCMAFVPAGSGPLPKGTKLKAFLM